MLTNEKVVGRVATLSKSAISDQLHRMTGRPMPEPFDPYYTWLGIPKSEQPADYYRLLGIQRFEENREVISNAADQRMGHVRSFQTGPSARDSQQVLNELSKAAGCLLNPRRKAMYDQHLRSQGVTSQTQAAQRPPEKETNAGVVIQVSTKHGPSKRPATNAKPPLPARGASLRRKQLIAASTLIAIIGVSAVIWNWRNGGTPVQPLDSQVTAALAPASAAATELNSGASKPTERNVPPVAIKPESTGKKDPATTIASTSIPSSKKPGTETSPAQAVAPSAATNPAPATPKEPPNASEAEPQTEIPAGRPKGLHFRGNDRVELAATTGLLDFGQPFTLETSVRFGDGSAQWIAGDLIIGPNHSQVPGGTVAGWQLFLQSPQSDRQRIAFSTREGNVGEFPVAANSWHHIAVCSNGTQLSIFVDGRRAASGDLGRVKDAYQPSPIPIHLGVHGYMHSNQPPGFTGDMRAFRVSAVCRYTANFDSSNFESGSNWSKDADTLILLDFLNSTGNQLVDASGNGHNGAISGARWIELEVPATAAVASTGSSSVPTPSKSPMAKSPLATSAPENTPPGTIGPPSLPGLTAEPVPPEVAIIQAGEQMRKVFGDEFENLKDPKQQMALVEKLLKLAAESQDDAAARYVMMDEAQKLAVQAGELARSLTVIDELAKLFVIDAPKLKVAALTKCGDMAKTTADRRRVAEIGVGLLDELIVAGRFDAAGDIAQAAVAAATRAKDADLVKAAREYRDEIAQAKRRWAEAREAESKLAENKDDGELNLRWGRFLCFYQRNWSQGLPHLGLSSLTTLAAVAKQDLANPTVPEEQIALGEAWVNVMKTVEAAERPAVALRALYWLNQAEPQLKGLAKANVEKKVKELETSLPSRYRLAAGKPSLPGATTGMQPPKEFWGALGRIQVNGTDAGVMWKYEAGLRLTSQSVGDIVTQVGLPRGKLRMEFAGFFYAHESMTVNVNHLGGSPTGTATLFVDNKPLGEVGGPRATSDVYKLEVSAGEHAIRWVITGDDLGTNRLNFTNAATAQAIPLYHNPALMNLVRENPTRARLNVNMTR